MNWRNEGNPSITLEYLHPLSYVTFDTKEVEGAVKSNPKDNKYIFTNIFKTNFLVCDNADYNKRITDVSSHEERATMQKELGGNISGGFYRFTIEKQPK